jgi:hypothetical protein
MTNDVALDRKSAVLDDAHLGDIRGALGTIRAGDIGARTGLSARLKTLLAIVGPGLIVMVGDNDAGVFGTYTQAGQNYGTRLLWTLLLLIPVLYANKRGEERCPSPRSSARSAVSVGVALTPARAAGTEAAVAYRDDHLVPRQISPPKDSAPADGDQRADGRERGPAPGTDLGSTRLGRDRAHRAQDRHRPYAAARSAPRPKPGRLDAHRIAEPTRGNSPHRQRPGVPGPESICITHSARGERASARCPAQPA